MSYTQAIKWRSFSFYNNQWRRHFVSGRNESVVFQRAVEGVAAQDPVTVMSRQLVAAQLESRYRHFWRSPKGKRAYGLKTMH